MKEREEGGRESDGGEREENRERNWGEGEVDRESRRGGRRERKCPAPVSYRLCTAVSAMGL